MAAADLLTIITQVILRRINIYYFPWNVLRMTPVCKVLYVLRHAARGCSVWFTVTFTFDRYVAICCQKLKDKYCTGKTATVVLTVTGALVCFKNSPKYFILQPWAVIDGISWLCFLKSVYFTEPGWVGFDWFDAISTPLLPFGLILLFNILTVNHILVASRVRRSLRGQNKGEKTSDPEMESRRKSIILLFTLSASFILLWLLYVIDSFFYSIAGISTSDYNNAQYILRHVGEMFLHLNCCTNTFIYAVTQSKFREQIKGMVKYPVTSFIRLIN
ncbi:probable G-protein coupled receptor 139 [Hypanus sabinus]|uniref:probable G-protein coupled receptor 139 n=1 Tax=Hypanus sabinus TaxID=79690 RepID=UPI0028C4F785|nr:probable G-protein coupled receptor 139 [Hypanus sabinus]